MVRSATNYILLTTISVYLMVHSPDLQNWINAISKDRIGENGIEWVGRKKDYTKIIILLRNCFRLIKVNPNKICNKLHRTWNYLCLLHGSPDLHNWINAVSKDRVGERRMGGKEKGLKMVSQSSTSFLSFYTSYC